MAVLLGGKKSGHNEEVTVRQSLTVLLHYMSTDVHKMKEK